MKKKQTGVIIMITRKKW